MQPEGGAQLSHLRLELLDAPADFVFRHPRVGAERLGLEPQGFHAFRIPAALGDARLELGVSRSQTNQLLVIERVLDGHRGRLDVLFRVGMRELLQRFLDNFDFLDNFPFLDNFDFPDSLD